MTLNLRTKLLIIVLAMLVPLAVATLGTPATAPAESRPLGLAAPEGCELATAFHPLHDRIPAIVGECLENELPGPGEGDRSQVTTQGLLIWRLATQTAAFTDGYRTWVDGPNGLEERLNNEQFEWEAAAADPDQAQPTGQTEPGGHDVDWGYEGEGSPSYWGDLSPEYAACASGQQQSPIDITGVTPSSLPELQFHHELTPLEVVNNGHTIQINYAEGSFLTIGGDRYELLQFHFHAPSEHTISGKAFGLEAHLVHRNAEGRLAVVGLLLEEGATNAILEPIWSKLPHEEGAQSVPGAAINVGGLLPTDHSYYAYAGSLTTPPCSEGVAWYLLQTPVEASAEQIAQFASLFPPLNARPAQPLHERTVQASS